MLFMNDGFCEEINYKTELAIEKGNAFFIKKDEKPLPLLFNSFKSKPITGANYYNLQLTNNLNNKNHTEFVNAYDVLQQKPNWLKLKDDLLNNKRPLSTVIKDIENGKTKLSFMLPAAELNQDIIKDNKKPTPLKCYVPMQTNNADKNDFDAVALEHFTNLYNSSLTQSSFRNNIKDYSKFLHNLHLKISNNPNYLYDINEKAHKINVENYFLPFDKKYFIKQARDFQSEEFKKLHNAISEHVENIQKHSFKSFNVDFDKLSSSLIEKLNNMELTNDNRASVIKKNTFEFIKENIVKDKPADTLVNTFLGTVIEKAKKLAKDSKHFICAAVIAASLMGGSLAYAGGQSDNAQDGKWVSASSYSSNPQVMEYIFNNKNLPDFALFKEKNNSHNIPAEKIIKFDYSPFDINEDGKIDITDYKLARGFENKIIKNTPELDPYVYNMNMEFNNIIIFNQKITEKTGKPYNADNHNYFTDVATRIYQLSKNDTLVATRSTDNRTYFAEINRIINENPKILENAISSVENNKSNNNSNNTKSSSRK